MPSPGSSGVPGQIGTPQIPVVPDADSTGAQSAGQQGGQGEVPGAGGWETSNQTPPAPTSSSRANLPQPSGQDSRGKDALDRALEDFDGEILAERGVIAQRSNEKPAGTGTMTPSAGDPASGGAQGTADASGTGKQASQSRTGVPRTARPTPAMPGSGSGQHQGDGMGDAKDDDIIARQLREAAMAEPDPELREKLWQEYERYKGI